MLSKDEVDRQNFEAWFVPIYHPRHMNRNNAGDYLFIDAEIAWMAWKARSAELLSLREQMEVLNNLSPAAWMDEKGNVCTADNRLRGLTAECSDAYRKYNIPLFTAAKPVEE
ncbi:TPA: hypothetical protein ACNAAR_001281 [Yersinia enterocolitica]